VAGPVTYHDAQEPEAREPPRPETLELEGTLQGQGFGRREARRESETPGRWPGVSVHSRGSD